MNLPDIARLEALRMVGDEEADPLMEKIVVEHGIHGLAALLWLIRRTKPFAEACLESLARTLVRDLAGTQTANRLWIARAPLVHWVVGEIARGLMTLAEMRGRKDWLPRRLGGEAREKGFPRLLGRQFAKMR